jgi:hypothetical protein
VIGSNELVSDLGLGVGRLYNYQGLQGDYESGLQLLYNLVEWSVADDALASIRTGGPTSRVLRPLEEEERRSIEFNQYLIALMALIMLAFINIAPRRFQAGA